MKTSLALVLPLVLAPSLFAQSSPAAGAPGDPKAFLTKVIPLYDYASADMPPWHIRYHLKDSKEGSPTGEGSFEYWWSTNKVSKASWTIGGRTQTDWRMPDGKDLRLVTGGSSGADGFLGIDVRMIDELLPGFVKASTFPTHDHQLKGFTWTLPTHTFQCLASVAPANLDKKIESPATVFPAYCFTEGQPALVFSHENGTVTTLYNQPHIFHNHTFSDGIDIYYAGKKQVEASLEELNQVTADDPAFTPSADAKEYVVQTSAPIVSRNIALPVLIKRVNAVYPANLRAAHVEGKVVIAAKIGKDGRVKDAKVISSPDGSFSDAALEAVRQWGYQPTMVGGQPAEVNTTITVNFAIPK